MADPQGHAQSPLLHSVAIADLRPTQMTVGMREVEQKRKEWRTLDVAKTGGFLGRHMIPVVRGPKSRTLRRRPPSLGASTLRGGRERDSDHNGGRSSCARERRVLDLSRQSRLDAPLRRRRRSPAADEFAEDRCPSGRRSLSQPCGRAAVRRRLCERYHSFQRIPLGRCAAPPRQIPRPSRTILTLPWSRRLRSPKAVRRPICPAGAGRMTGVNRPGRWRLSLSASGRYSIALQEFRDIS